MPGHSRFKNGVASLANAPGIHVFGFQSVARERIRQIEAKALRKLKHPSRSRKLRSFLDH